MKWALALGLLMVATVSSHETLTTTVLFDREIVRILDQHCVMCHSDGGPSFPLETYDQTWLKRRAIHTQVIARHMPPWAAVPGYGQFANDNSLTLRESQFIISWVEGLGPRNSGTVYLNITEPDAARPAEVRAHGHFGDWQIGKPDVIRELPAIAIPGGGEGVEHRVIDLGLTRERLIRAMEFLPRDRRNIHSAFFTIQETGQFIGAWTPWYGFMALPTGAAFRVPAGAHIIAEIQYRNSGAAQAFLQGSLGLTFADGAAALAQDLVLDGGLAVYTKQGDKLQASAPLQSATRIYALRPIIGAGVQSLELSARLPDGRTEVLLYAKDFPMDWPTPYIFKRPMDLPAGATLVMTAHSGGPSPMRLIVTRGAVGKH